MSQEGIYAAKKVTVLPEGNEEKKFKSKIVPALVGKFEETVPTQNKSKIDPASSIVLEKMKDSGIVSNAVEKIEGKSSTPKRVNVLMNQFEKETAARRESVNSIDSGGSRRNSTSSLDSLNSRSTQFTGASSEVSTQSQTNNQPSKSERLIRSEEARDKSAKDTSHITQYASEQVVGTRANRLATKANHKAAIQEATNSSKLDKSEREKFLKEMAVSKIGPTKSMRGNANEKVNERLFNAREDALELAAAAIKSGIEKGMPDNKLKKMVKLALKEGFKKNGMLAGKASVTTIDKKAYKELKKELGVVNKKESLQLSKVEQVKNKEGVYNPVPKVADKPKEYLNDKKDNMEIIKGTMQGMKGNHKIVPPKVKDNNVQSTRF